MIGAILAKAERLIGRPLAGVFEHFVDPEFTTRFWFTSSTGRLVAGERVQWQWEMYDATSEVRVREVTPAARIAGTGRQMDRLTRQRASR